MLPKSKTLPYKDTTYCISYIWTNRKKRSYFLICHFIHLCIHSLNQCLPTIFISALAGVGVHAKLESLSFCSHTHIQPYKHIYIHTYILTLQNKSLYMLLEASSTLLIFFPSSISSVFYTSSFMWMVGSH